MKHIVMGVMLLAVAATPGLSAVVVFDNSAQQFRFSAFVNSQMIIGNHLDPSRAPDDQANIDVAQSMRYTIPPFNSSFFFNEQFVGGASLQFARPLEPVGIRNDLGILFETFPARVYQTGELVEGPFGNFDSRASVSWYAGQIARLPLLGDRATIGWRQAVPGGFRYGWIELEFQVVDQPPNSLSFNNLYQPIRWAYETEPNVPIVVPAPTAIGLLALAGLVASRRRRRA